VKKKLHKGNKGRGSAEERAKVPWNVVHCRGGEAGKEWGMRLSRVRRVAAGRGRGTEKRRKCRENGWLVKR